MKLFLLLFISTVIVRFLYYLSIYFENLKLHKIWNNYFIILSKNKFDSNAITYTKAIQNHFKITKINDIAIPLSKPILGGKIAFTQTTAFANIFANDNEISSYINDAFLQAKGVCRDKMKECFRLSYWFQLIIFLPKNIIEYLGLDANTILDI